MNNLTAAQQALSPALERIDRDTKYVSDLLDIIHNNGGALNVWDEISIARIEDWLSRIRKMQEERNGKAA